MRENADNPDNRETYNMKGCGGDCKDIISTKQEDCNFLKLMDKNNKYLNVLLRRKRFDCKSIGNEKKCNGNVRNCDSLNQRNLTVCFSEVLK